MGARLSGSQLSESGMKISTGGMDDTIWVDGGGRDFGYRSKERMVEGQTGSIQVE